MWTIPLRTLWSAVVLVAFVVTAARAEVPIPSLEGPITSPGGAFVTPPSGLDLSDFGYVEEEFFASGTARAHTASGALGSDGKWTASPDGDTAAYKTRVLVRRPASKKQFNGTVVVEWLNVSGGLDAAPDWTFLHPMLKRDGYAWVGVSAQFVGVAGTGGPLGLSLSLKSVNPARYGSLVHPGDSYSYDMFSQVGAALRQSGTPLLGALKPSRIIAIGESQSAFRMVTYVNAVHPTAKVFDGFLIHSRGDDGAALSQSPQTSILAPTPSFVRDDVDVPTLIFETETDLIILGFFAARQPDGNNVRTWETAGTSHDDAYGLSYGPGDTGVGALDTTYLPPVTSIFGVLNCGRAINAGPQHYILSAALRRLDKWVRRGKVSGGPHSPQLEASAGNPPTEIDRDTHGNALGGIRTPAVDAPILTLSGLGQDAGGFCGIFGTTVPFDAPTLAALYPSHARYVSAVSKSAKRAVHAGYLINVDAKSIVSAAKGSSIGN